MKKLVSFGLAVTLAVSGVSSLVAPTPVNAEASSYSYSFTKEQQDALNHINAIREKLGVPAVKLSPFLIKAAENHAKYLSINGFWDGHDEYSNKKGFTGSDPSSRIVSVGGIPNGYYSEGLTNLQSSIVSGIDSLMTAPYHRVSIASPSLEEIGVAISGGIVVIEYSSGEVVSGSPNSVEYMYPYNGQTNVDIGFYGNEVPNPLASYGLSKSGFILTYSAPGEVAFDSTTAKLVNSKGVEIPVIIDGIMGTLHIIPKTELAYNEKYTVTVSYKGSDRSQDWKEVSGTRTWSFTTKPNPNPPVVQKPAPKPPVKK